MLYNHYRYLGICKHETLIYQNPQSYYTEKLTYFLLIILASTCDFTIHTLFTISRTRPVTLNHKNLSMIIYQWYMVMIS